mmetsp:Transcript_4462/g.8237  ORF Transcript_4462/g.8237 Transcript_4462/m.8237 type:complete len:294 (-) Transcript_4462:1245-2126(-)
MFIKLGLLFQESFFSLVDLRFQHLLLLIGQIRHVRIDLVQLSLKCFFGFFNLLQGLGHGTGLVHVRSVASDGLNVFVVTKSLGGTFFGSANVHFVALKPFNLFVNGSQDPGTTANSSLFKEQADSQKDVDDWIIDKEHGKGRGNQTPRNRTDQCRNNRTQQTGVEQFLNRVRHSKNIFAAFIHADGRNLGDKEHAGHHRQLASNHKCRQTTGVVIKQELTRLFGKVGLFAFGLGEFGDGKVGNLHGFQDTHDEQEGEKDDQGCTWWNGIPHFGLSREDGDHGNSEGHTENSQR